jgi:RNA polymerase sigma-70 factor, ECF subfamily
MSVVEFRKQGSRPNLQVVPDAPQKSYRDMDDAELIALCQRKDNRAFETLVKRHQRTVSNLLYRMAPDWDNHADLSQEVFIRMWRNIGRLKNPRAFKSWVTQITTNLFYDELRKKPKLRTISMDEPITNDDGNEGSTRDIEDKSAGPEELLHRQELEAVVQDAMNKLPEHFRTAIVLRELQQLSYEEIAVLTQSEIGTVKSRIARARSKVQGMIGNYVEKKAA